MSMISTQEVILDFYQCCIHMLLYNCQIYPEYLFENRSYLGILVKQSRHPQINEYINRVFENARPMLVLKLVDRIVFAVDTNDGKALYHITIKCQNFSENLSTSENKLVEEELRSAVLRMTMLDSQFTKHPDDCRWRLMVITKPAIEEVESDLLSEVLTTGEWMIDNNQTPEQVSLAVKVNSSKDTNSSSMSSVPRLKPLKSYRDEKINLSIFAHLFS